MFNSFDITHIECLITITEKVELVFQFDTFTGSIIVIIKSAFSKNVHVIVFFTMWQEIGPLNYK